MPVSLSAEAASLVNELNTTLAALYPATKRGLPATRGHIPIIDVRDFPETPQTVVVPADFGRADDVEDSCGNQFGFSLWILFSEKLTLVGDWSDPDVLTELDAIMDWTTALYEFISESSIGDFGVPKEIMFAAPSTHPMFVWDWLRDSGVYVSILRADYLPYDG